MSRCIEGGLIVYRQINPIGDINTCYTPYPPSIFHIPFHQLLGIKNHVNGNTKYHKGIHSDCKPA